MGLYDKRLKRSKDGSIVRYIGKNEKGVPEKFRLGYDLAEATRRERLIKALWEEIDYGSSHIPGVNLRKPFWLKDHLEAAKAIARGEPPRLPRGSECEDPVLYLRRIDALSEIAGERLLPSDPVHFQNGLERLNEDIATSKQIRATAMNVPDATGQSLEDAITAYETHLRASETTPDGRLTPWGKTQVDQFKSIRSYLSDARFGSRNFLTADLAELSFACCDGIYEVFRRRPLTFLSKFKRRMAPKSASNFLKAINTFFIWLDGADEFEWQLPRRYNTISRKTAPLTAEEQYERKRSKKASVIPTEHLKTLFDYSLPTERVLLLLGLNCAFGAAEIGHLRTKFVDIRQRVIDGIRFKTGNDTKHLLWPATVAGLTWTLEKRQGQPEPSQEYADIVFITERGKPLWHHTKKGNTSNGVSNVWDRLIKRIQKEQPTFPSYSFNKLRKTAATRILGLANAEVASMILAHKTISEDELLQHYVQTPWRKLFDAQEKFGNELAKSFNVLDPSPWKVQRRNHIGVLKAKQVLELDEEGVSAPNIAAQLGIALATVYRHLQDKYGKRPSGRKPAPDQNAAKILDSLESVG